MSAIHEHFLSAAELDELIKKLEEKYGRKTLELLGDTEFRSTVSEDDLFEWEALVSHKVDLEEMGDEIRRKYLQQVSQAPADTEPAAGEKQVLLAA
jgi:hypothetical protein